MSNDGTKIAASDCTCNSVRCYVTWLSTDSGATWNQLANAPSNEWLRGMASSGDFTRLAMITYTGEIWSSTDSGSTWSMQPHTRVGAIGGKMITAWQGIAMCTSHPYQLSRCACIPIRTLSNSYNSDRGFYHWKADSARRSASAMTPHVYRTAVANATIALAAAECEPPREEDIQVTDSPMRA